MQTQQAIQLNPYPLKEYGKNSSPHLYVVDTPSSTPVAKRRLPSNFEVNLTIISDRIPRYSKYNQQFVTAIQQGNVRKANKIRNKVRKDLQNRISQLIPNAGIKIADTLGVWEEGLEQSFRISFSNLRDDVVYTMVKIAEDFDQDAVHFLRPVQPSEVTRPLGISNDKGNIFTSTWEFSLTNPLTVPEFQKIIGQCGLPGAQLSKNGKLVTIYNAYNAEQSTTEQAANSATIEWEKRATNFAQKLQQRGPAKATIGFAEFRSYGRDLHSATRTYKELERYIFPKKQHEQGIENLLPATGINWLFKKMDNLNESNREYKSLAKMIQLQYSKIPVRVYAWATPVQQADGSIQWKDNSTEYYKNSNAMKQDVENNNRFIFHTTSNKANEYHTNQSLLEMTEFFSNPQQVLDEEGKLVFINGKPKTAQYRLTLGDTLYILQHLKSCMA